MRNGGLRTQPGGAQVDSHLRVPVLERQGIDRLLAIDRRHVDEDVQPPEFSDGLFDNAPARLGLLQIGLDDERAPRQRAKRGGRFLRFGAGGAVYDGDVRPFAGELGGDDRADTPSAGDQGDSIDGSGASYRLFSGTFAASRKAFRTA